MLDLDAIVAGLLTTRTHKDVSMWARDNAVQLIVELRACRERDTAVRELVERYKPIQSYDKALKLSVLKALAKVESLYEQR